jgi:allantoate deiminase
MSIERIQRDIEVLATFSEPCECGITRPSYTASYRKAADYLIGQMRQAGLTINEDRAGNIFGTLAGRNKIKVVSGSHLDTVKEGGAFDGTAGIVCALEAARLLREQNQHLDYTYEVAAFAGEEGTRFGQVLLGSKMITGSIGTNQMDLITDDAGITLKQAIAAYHGSSDTGNNYHKDDTVVAFVELHIEQGPILYQDNIEIGIVERIQGVCWIKIIVEGSAGHAGTIPMNSRRDAGLAAYQLIIATSHFVTEYFLNCATLTVGKMDLFPGSSNVIPGKCAFTMDIRGATSDIMDDILHFINAQIQHLQIQCGVSIYMEIMNRNEPTLMNRELIACLQKATETAGYSYKTMNSGAGHDAMELASIWKTAMIFVPSIGGITHHPDEFTPFASLEKAAQVLLHTLLIFQKTGFRDLISPITYG